MVRLRHVTGKVSPLEYAFFAVATDSCDSDAAALTAGDSDVWTTSNACRTEPSDGSIVGVDGEEFENVAATFYRPIFISSHFRRESAAQNLEAEPLHAPDLP